MSGPAWLNIAGHYLGVAETPGKETTPVIARWLINLGAWWSSDDADAPWCGVFCAEVMRESNIALPKAWYRAKAWLAWGVPLDEPVVGCVVVFERAGGGHVGFVVGKDARGYLLVLGGNQGNRVSIAAFDPIRVAGFRWPPLVPAPNSSTPMRVADLVAPISHNEG